MPMGLQVNSPYVGFIGVIIATLICPPSQSPLLCNALRPRDWISCNYAEDVALLVDAFLSVWQEQTRCRLLP